MHQSPICRRIWFLIFNRNSLLRRKALIGLFALSAGMCFACHAQPLVIVVAGDGRAEYSWKLPHRSCDEWGNNNAWGINKWVTTAIANAVVKEDPTPSILLWTGDIVNVNDANKDTLEQGLTEWRNIMKPVYEKNNKSIQVWPVRGNHEVYRYLDGKYDGDLIKDSPDVWKKIFPELRQKDAKSDDGLSFYSAQDSVLIVGLDEYAGAATNVFERRHKVDLTWLSQVLQRNKRPFTVVFGHEAAFMAGHHTDDDTLAADANARDLFLQSLIDAKAIYFCGHDHFYDRMGIARSSSKPGSPPSILQITAGTAGAPFYPAGQYAGSAVWREDRAAHFDNVYGYILIKVDGNKAVITFKGAAPSAFNGTDEVTFTPMDQIVCDGAGCHMAFCEGD